MISLIDLYPNCVHMKIIPIYTLYIKYNQKQNVSHLQFDQGSESKIYDLMVRFYNEDALASGSRRSPNLG